MPPSRQFLGMDHYRHRTLPPEARVILCSFPFRHLPPYLAHVLILCQRLVMWLSRGRHDAISALTDTICCLQGRLLAQMLARHPLPYPATTCLACLAPELP